MGEFCSFDPSGQEGHLVCDPPPWSLHGITLYVGQPFFAFPVGSDARGAHRLPVSLVSMPVGTQVDLQYAWLNLTSCKTAPLLSASNLLAIRVKT